MSDIYAYSGPEIIAKIGVRYRMYRQQLQLTQKEIAEKTGLSIMTIQKFEVGASHDISMTTLLRLLRAIGQLENINEILPDIPESPYLLNNKTPIQRIRHSK